MEIICECGHRLRDHEESQGGCWYHYFGGSCYCNLLPEVVEARYWGKWAYKQMQAAIRSTNHWMIIASDQKKEYDTLLEQRDTYKIRLWGQYCKKCSKDNKYDTPDAHIHASQYCPGCGKKMVWLTTLGEPLTYAELQEQLRMCQLALRTADQAQTELASYIKIAVDALRKIAKARGGIIVTDDLGHKIEFNNYEADIAIEALDKIKGKF
jgi:hypothetical protein